MREACRRSRGLLDDWGLGLRLALFPGIGPLLLTGSKELGIPTANMDPASLQVCDSGYCEEVGGIGSIRYY
jgi:hypothetical protein